MLCRKCLNGAGGLVFAELDTGSTGGDYSLDTHSTQDSDVSLGHKHGLEENDNLEGH